MVELAGHAERMRQVGRADEQDVHAVGRRDRVGLVERADRLDLDDADDPVVDLPDVSVGDGSQARRPASEAQPRARRPAGSGGT